jgi:hypothetical protein
MRMRQLAQAGEDIMMRLVGPMDEFTGTVTYDIGNGRYATFDVREVERFGLARLLEVSPVDNLVRYAAESRAREIEAAIERFRECGVELARFSIVEKDGVTYLCVDGVARFSWQIRWPGMGKPA